MDNVYTPDDVNIFKKPVRIIIAGVTESGKTEFTTSSEKVRSRI